MHSNVAEHAFPKENCGRAQNNDTGKTTVSSVSSFKLAEHAFPKANCGRAQNNDTDKTKVSSVSSFKLEEI